MTAYPALIVPEVPETLAELVDRVALAGCRILRVHQKTIDHRYQVTVANKNGAEIMETGETIQEALSEAFTMVMLTGGAD